MFDVNRISFYFNETDVTLIKQEKIRGYAKILFYCQETSNES